MLGNLGVPELIVIAAILAMPVLVMWPAARICRRVGLSRWLGVLAVIPLANLVLLWFVAFAPWPAASDAARAAARPTT